MPIVSNHGAVGVVPTTLPKSTAAWSDADPCMGVINKRGSQTSTSHSTGGSSDQRRSGSGPAFEAGGSSCSASGGNAPNPTVLGSLVPQDAEPDGINLLANGDVVGHLERLSVQMQAKQTEAFHTIGLIVENALKKQEAKLKHLFDTHLKSHGSEPGLKSRGSLERSDHKVPELDATGRMRQVSPAAGKIPAYMSQVVTTSYDRRRSSRENVSPRRKSAEAIVDMQTSSPRDPERSSVNDGKDGQTKLEFGSRLSTEEAGRRNSGGRGKRPPSPAATRPAVEPAEKKLSFAKDKRANSKERSSKEAAHVTNPHAPQDEAIMDLDDFGELDATSAERPAQIVISSPMPDNRESSDLVSGEARNSSSQVVTEISVHEPKSALKASASDGSHCQEVVTGLMSLSLNPTPERTDEDTESSCSSDSSGYTDYSEDSETMSEKGRRLGGRRFSEWEVNQRAKSLIIGDDVMTSEDDEDGRPWYKMVSESNMFDQFAATLLLANACFIGFEVELRGQGQATDDLNYLIADIAFCLLFGGELIFRILGAGWYNFYFDVAWQWAWFDTAVVCSQVFELLLTFASRTSGEMANFLALGRLARVVRIVRVVRVVRVLRFFRSFRILLTMIFGTLKNGVWAALLLILIMYIFGVFFAQNVADTIAHEKTDESEGYEPMDEKHKVALYLYFGTLPRAVFTLFKSIIGGLDWHDVVLPLSQCGWWNVLFFLAYMIFIQLVVMNVVTGLFLQSAIEQAQQDQEHGIQVRLDEKEVFVTRLEQLFKELDSSNDGSISLQEFEAHLQSPHMQALLQTFEIENADAWTLFKLLDADGGGSVDIDEFVSGCIRLKGPARSIQIAQLMYHHKWIMNQLVELQEGLSNNLKPISKHQKIVLKKLDNLELSKAASGALPPPGSKRNSTLNTMPGAGSQRASLMSLGEGHKQGTGGKRHSVLKKAKTLDVAGSPLLKRGASSDAHRGSSDVLAATSSLPTSGRGSVEEPRTRSPRSQRNSVGSISVEDIERNANAPWLCS